MPPPLKFSKEEIVRAALELLRDQGVHAVTARAVARQLDASPKVIFGTFSGMPQLMEAVRQAAQAFWGQFILQAMADGALPPYKASGMAYIRFAREEREVFRLLFMCNSDGLPPEEDPAVVEPILNTICRNTGLDRDAARQLHLESWIFVHGFAVMIATGYLDWDEAFISEALTDCYLGLKERFCGKDAEHGSHTDSETDQKI